jgi:hypothetical protein
VKIKRCSVAVIFALIASGIAMAQQAATSQPTPKPIKKPGFFSRARFETKYDKFKDTTTVQFKRLPLTGTGRRVFSGETLYLIGAFRFKGQAIAAPVNVAYIGFLSESENWLYLQDKHLIALIDGERLDVGIAARDSDIGLGKVTELLVFDISYETLLKIANGTNVEMQLGSRELKLKDNHLYALRDLADRMR